MHVRLRCRAVSKWAVILVGGMWPALAFAAEPAPAPAVPVAAPVMTRSSVYAPRGVVCANNPLASQAGLKVLEAGGNAFDAAVVAAAVMNVTEPMMTGIGGDMFAIAWV